MVQADLLFLATKAFAKSWDNEQIYYCDELYEYTSIDKNLVMDTILDYMDELKEIGRKAFYEKYKEYKLY